MSFIKRETKNFILKFMHVFNGEKQFSECKLMKSRCSVKFMRRFEKNGSFCDCCSLFLNGFTDFSLPETITGSSFNTERNRNNVIKFPYDIEKSDITYCLFSC